MISHFSEDPKGVNDLCPRLNGFYAHPDPGVCDIFYACVDGVAEEYTCSSGLYFDEYKGVCNWPSEAERGACNSGNNNLTMTLKPTQPVFLKFSCSSSATDHQITDSGFKCPKVEPVDGFGLSDPHPKYADPDDCAKFYICLNGISPRAQGCELGLVYNTVTKQCDSPENVPEW